MEINHFDYVKHKGQKVLFLRMADSTRFIYKDCHNKIRVGNLTSIEQITVSEFTGGLQEYCNLVTKQ